MNITPPKRNVTDTQAGQQKVAQVNEETKAEAQSQAGQGVKIADLISSKKYFLNIKEKRHTPIITLGLSQRKKYTRTNTRRYTTQKTPKQHARRSTAGSMTLVILLFSIVAGAYLALDAGWIDIGWKPPIRLIGK